MTPRDREIYNFIEMVGICTAQQIREIFIPKVDIAKTYHRLRVLVDEGLVRVSKVGLNNYYYVGRKTSKKMLEHDLKTTDLIGYLKRNGANITSFKRNKIIGKTISGNIFVDGYVTYKLKIGEKTFKRHILIEVQRSIQYKPDSNYGHLYGCIAKYNHDSIKEGLKKLCEDYGFKQVPPLVVVTDIRDTTSSVFTTQLIKLPFIENELWGILIR